MSAAAPLQRSFTCIRLLVALLLVMPACPDPHHALHKAPQRPRTLWATAASERRHEVASLLRLHAWVTTYVQAHPSLGFANATL